MRRQLSGHLAPVNQQAKCSRLGSRLRTLLFRVRGGRLEIGGVDEQIVRLRIERHGFRAELRLDRLDHAEFIGRVFMENVNRSVAGGAGG